MFLFPSKQYMNYGVKQMTNEQIIERIDYIQNSLDVIKQSLRTSEAFKTKPVGVNPVQRTMDFGQQDHIGE